jgi:hypothetical protein
MDNYEDAFETRGPRATEGTFTKTVEQYTASVPSSAYLGAAIGAMGLSLAFQLAGRDKWSNFITRWVPTLLVIGMYNKLVKVEGHEHAGHHENRGYTS